MKLLALAAALAFAGAAHAQTAPATTPTDSTQTNASAPVGGLAAPPTVAYVTPGQPYTAPTPPTVEQAFPAPAPQAHYPLCSRTVRDQCRQRGG